MYNILCTFWNRVKCHTFVHPWRNPLTGQHTLVSLSELLRKVTITLLCHTVQRSLHICTNGVLDTFKFIKPGHYFSWEYQFRTMEYYCRTKRQWPCDLHFIRAAVVAVFRLIFPASFSSIIFSNSYLPQHCVVSIQIFTLIIFEFSNCLNDDNSVLFRAQK